MNIGLYFECSKRSGSAYQYALNVLEAFKNNPDHRYTVFTASSDLPTEFFSLPNFEIVDLRTNMRGTQSTRPAPTSPRRKVNLLILKVLRSFKLASIERVLAKRNAERRSEAFYGYGVDLMFYHGPSELSFLSKIPAVTVIHDVNYLTAPHDVVEFANPHERSRREYLVKNTLQKSWKVIVASGVVKRSLMGRYGVDGRKILTMVWTVAPYFSKENRRPNASKDLLPSQYLLYPAHFWPHKNHRNLLEAIRLLKESGIVVPLVLCGAPQANWNTYHEVATFIREHKLTDSVVVLGYVDEEDMRTLYERANAVIIADTAGSMKLTAYEAAEVKKPLIASNKTDLAQTFSASGLFFNPNDPYDIAEKIKAFWSNGQLAKSLAEAALSFKISDQKDFLSFIREIITEFQTVQPQEDIREIKDGNTLLATVFSHKLKVDGVRFLTPLHYPFQIGLHEYKDEREVPMHMHRDLRFDIDQAQEMLYVERGLVDVVIASKQWKVIKEVPLTRGDFILFSDGAHSVTIHKNSRLLEVKQGPYPGDHRAKIFQK